MKILHISPEAPGYSSGGRLGVLQTSLSIATSDNIVDYVGPKIEDYSIRSLYNQTFFLERDKNQLRVMFNLMRGITNKSFYFWNKLKIDILEYDKVVVDFTKQSYLIKKIKSVPLIVRVHNVEYDYAKEALKTNWNLKNFFIRMFARRSEKMLVERANRIVALTEKDASRLIDLYPKINKEIDLVPVCLRSKINAIRESDISSNIIVSGSLWFGGNYFGIKWLLESVLPIVKSNYSLIIAGKNPNEELARLIKTYSNVKLVANPDAMDPYFQECSLALAPVFDGAGMKVKVAEALSYGLPVVGTEHALIGYSITNGVDSYCADDALSFASAIDSYLDLSKPEKYAVRNAALKLFNEKYSIDNSINKWKIILSDKNYARR